MKEISMKMGVIVSLPIIFLLVSVSFVSALNESNEQSTEKNVVNNILSDSEPSPFGKVTVNVIVFGWYPDIGGWPYLLSGAFVFIRVVGIIPSIFLCRNLVGLGVTNFTGHCTIKIPAPRDNSFCYLVYARKFGFRPCYRPDFPAQSYQFIKLKANDNPDDIWLVLIGWPFGDIQT